MRTLRIYIKYLFMILLILNITLFSSCAENKQLDVENKPIDLGIPTKKYYPSNNIARCVWDMKIFNNKLYIGCGDYNNNSGPTPVLYTSLDDIGNWHEEGVLPDEQIGRFCMSEKIVLTMNDFERRLLVGCINQARTDYIEAGKPIDSVNELLIKAIDAPTKKEKRKLDREGR